MARELSRGFGSGGEQGRREDKAYAHAGVGAKDHVFGRDAGNRVEAGGRTRRATEAVHLAAPVYAVVIAVEHYLVGAGIHHRSRAQI